ncbi:DUF930 domain-containing protein [Devosia ginsengisoli]|uniref:DUF930 domain-containing protein n=1 Tax=Devosia ginsengisoli TaxID=400770 RepID=UPI0026EFC748|nr:DUF930 domain-containing protein [Devosia ginsengisoli]MCR6671123.1 DUF930 domain-containing protein [Devosia ginsengisoli]
MPHRPDILVRWTLPASLLAHGALLAALLLLTVPRTLERVPMRAIAVELVPAQAEPPPPAIPATEAMPAAPVEPAPPETAGDDDGMVVATDFYASGILSDPANAEVRRNFPLLATSEQVIQLCNMEALEQLRSAEPAVMADALVGYAFDSMEVSGNALDAEGGAVRSGGKWFHFRYHCAVAPDIASVSAFEYAMGPAIPRGEWEEHFLNADDDWLN